MTIFWILLGCTYGLFWFFKQTNSELKYTTDYKCEYNCKMKPYFIVMSLFMIALVGLRHNTVGLDTDNYEFMYGLYNGVDFKYILSPEVEEKAYIFCEILFNKLGLTFQQFNIAYACFNVSVISYLIYKQSETPWFSYILYICFAFFTLLFTMVRQTTAMSIVILAVLFDKKNGIKSFIKFTVLVYIASLFHQSAWVCLPMWFIKRVKYNNIVGIALIFAAVGAFLFKSQISLLLLKVASQLRDKYEVYSNIGVGNLGIKLYLMLIACVVFSVVIPDFLKEKKNLFAFFCMCVVVVIFPAVQGGGALMRVYYYYYVYMIIYISNMLSDIKNETNLFFKAVIFALFMAVGLSSYQSNLEWFHVAPYMFYWQG